MGALLATTNTSGGCFYIWYYCSKRKWMGFGYCYFNVDYGSFLKKLCDINLKEDYQVKKLDILKIF